MARRRRRGTWFPNLGTLGPEGNTDDDDSGLFGSLPIPAGSDSTVTLIQPLTFDTIEEDEADETTDSLSDIIGGEYIVQRIVGNIFCHRDTRVLANQSAPCIKVCAGFFVARQADSSISRDEPIGANSPGELREDYSPAQAAVIREPWMWRRVWLLGNQGTAANNSNQALVTAQSASNYPPTNVGYGNYMSGSGLDVKSKRRVRQDERLWFVIAARALVERNWSSPFLNPSLNEDRVDFHLDYRIYGSLVKAAQRSSF